MGPRNEVETNHRAQHIVGPQEGALECEQQEKIKNTYRQEGLMLKQSLGRGPRRRGDHRGSLRKGLFVSAIWTMRIKCER